MDVGNHQVPRLRPGRRRRVNLKIFPNHISCFVRDPIIWILPITHSYSRPKYWIDRVKTVG
jgi:hypothetical protein